MMKKIEKNFNYILIVILLLNPFVDLIVSLSIRYVPNLSSVGTIFRGLILMFLVIYFLFYKKYIKNKYVILGTISIIVYFGLYLLNMYVTKDQNITILIQETIVFIRNLYYPVFFLVLFMLIKEQKNINPISNKYLIITLITYSLFIILPFLTNTSFDSYAHSKTGSAGWFNSANEISAIIAVVLPFVFYFLVEKNNKLILKLIVPLIVISSIIILGTKTPILALGIILVVYIIIYIIKIIKEKKNLYLLIIIFGGMILSVVIIPFTPVYKNLQTHYDFLEIENISELIKNPVKLDHFIFGERIKFLNDTKEVYEKNYSPLIGIGYIDPVTTEEYKTVEMDFADIFYRNGILMFVFIFIFIPIIYIKEVLKYHKKNISNISYYLSFVLAILISITAGHVITSPSVATILAIIMIMYLMKLKSGEVSK